MSKSSAYRKLIPTPGKPVTRHADSFLNHGLLVVGVLNFKDAITRKRASYTTRMSRTYFFQELEQRWAEAIKRQDKEALDKEFLADDYALRISDDTSREIQRSDWLAAIPIYNTRNFTIKSLEVREFGNVAVVSHSFYQEADVNGVDRSGQFFIVDVWGLRDGKWKVSARYSSPARQLPNVPKTGEGGFGS